MRIGILTGGGDVPGLNPCIKSVVRRAYEKGWTVLGFRRGWAGPLHVDPDRPAVAQPRWLEELTPEVVRTIDRAGGTHLHTSRLNPRSLPEGDVPAFLQGRLPAGDRPGTVDATAHVARVIAALGLDCVVAIGGDGTLTFARHLSEQGSPVVAIPKTMDNDVWGTDYCIGFSTAVTRSVEHIHALRSTTGSHERICVVELFGRHSGETALIAGWLADVDRVVIAESPCEVPRLADLVAQDRRSNPSSYAMVVVSEGARLTGGEAIEQGAPDAYGRRRLGGVGERIGEEIERRTGIGVIVQRLAYLMRAGPPDSLDRMVAVSFGALAVQQIERGAFGVMMALKGGRYATVPLAEVGRPRKQVDVAELFDAEAYRPKIHHLMDKPMFLY